MKLSRPSRPEPCSPRTYVKKKAEILARVHDAIQARRWECRDLHAVDPSIRRNSSEALMDGEEAAFSIRFACAVAEAVGIDPWDAGAPIVLPTSAPLPNIQDQVQPASRPLARPQPPAHRHAGQLALELAA